VKTLSFLFSYHPVANVPVVLGLRHIMLQALMPCTDRSKSWQWPG
jgi:hypothetical protein